MFHQSHYTLSQLGISYEDIPAPAFSHEDFTCIVQFIEMTRHLQEIEQLFEIYRFNLQALHDRYEMFNTDIIISKFGPNPFDLSEGCILNALTINLISSGRTLTESIDVFINATLGEDAFDMFRSAHSGKEYDQYFPYRFLSNLRNYSQHGHLPVFIDFVDGETSCCFHLSDIVRTSHFKHNKKMEEEFLRIEDDILEKANDTPRISFTITLARYNMSVTKIYLAVYSFVRDHFIETAKKVKDILSDEPTFESSTPHPFNGAIAFGVDTSSGFLHLLYPKEDAIKWFVDARNTAKHVLRDEEAHFERFRDSFKTKSF